MIYVIAYMCFVDGELTQEAFESEKEPFEAAKDWLAVKWDRTAEELEKELEENEVADLEALAEHCFDSDCLVSILGPLKS